jgi:catechol-2,3-dioxygenase
VSTHVKARPHGLAPPAFRLRDATALGPVHLQVSDLMRALEYYQRVIGFVSGRPQTTPLS